MVIFGQAGRMRRVQEGNWQVVPEKQEENFYNPKAREFDSSGPKVREFYSLENIIE